MVRYDLVEGAREDLAELELDTIICLNVLEHIKDDGAALEGLEEMLCPGGRLILLVPAHRVLYSTLDKHLDHFRRYNRSGLVALVKKSGFHVEKSFHFNLLGALGWWINGCLLRRKILPGGQLKVFNLMTSLLRAENWITPPFGLSLVVIGRKETVAKTESLSSPVTAQVETSSGQ